MQPDENNLFVVTDVCNASAVGLVVLEGLHLQGPLEAA